MTQSHERVANQHHQPLPARDMPPQGRVRPENMSLPRINLSDIDFPTDRIDTDRLRQMVGSTAQESSAPTITDRPTIRSVDIGVSRWLTPKKVVAMSAVTLSLLGIGSAVAYDALGTPRSDETSLDIDTDNEYIKPTLSPETISIIEKFDSQRDAVLEKIMTKFLDDGFTVDSYHMYEGRTLENASPDMSAQAVLDRHVVKESFLTRDHSLSEALSEVDLVARQGTDAFGDVSYAVQKAIEDHTPISDEEILISSKKFSNGVVRNPLTGSIIAESHDIPTLITSGMSQNKRTVAVRVFQYITTTDGKKGDWQETYGSPSDRFPFDFNEIDKIPVNNH